MKLSRLKMTQISLICHAIVGDLLSTFANPANRGPNFSWDTFPDTMAKRCRVFLPMHLVMSERMKADCLAYAEQEGRAIAENWVKNLTK